MNLFIILAFLFFVGSMLGWVIELLFRRFFSSKKWINPGFLTGPYLPLYGFGTCGLYLIANLDVSFINSHAWQIVFVIFLMGCAMTLVEYVAGLIFIKGMHVRLWDYSDRFLNIDGIICPLFSLFWGLIAVVYYFFINPYILDSLEWLSRNLSFSFVIGLFFGVFLVDFGISTHLMAHLRQYAINNKVVLVYNNMKKFFMEKNNKKSFFGRKRSKIKEILEEYITRTKL